MENKDNRCCFLQPKPIQRFKRKPLPTITILITPEITNINSTVCMLPHRPSLSYVNAEVWGIVKMRSYHSHL